MAAFDDISFRHSYSDRPTDRSTDHITHAHSIQYERGREREYRNVELYCLAYRSEKKKKRIRKKKKSDRIIHLEMSHKPHRWNQGGDEDECATNAPPSNSLRSAACLALPSSIELTMLQLRTQFHPFQITLENNGFPLSLSRWLASLLLLLLLCICSYRQESRRLPDGLLPSFPFLSFLFLSDCLFFLFLFLFSCWRKKKGTEIRTGRIYSTHSSMDTLHVCTV